MRNFFRLLRYAWPYRYRFFASLVCAAIVALLWGANISAVYPLLNVLIDNQNSQNWINGEIAKSQVTIEAHQARLAEIDYVRAWQSKPDRTELRQRLEAAEENVAKALQLIRDQAKRASELAQMGDPVGERQARQDQVKALGQHKIAEARAEELRNAIDSVDGEQTWRLDRRQTQIGKDIENAKTWLNRYEWLKPYIDQYLPRDGFQTLLLLIIAVLGGVALKGFFMFLQESLVASLSQVTMFRIRNVFFRRTMALDMAQYGQQSTADLMARFTTDTEGVGQGISILLGKLVREPLRALSCLGAAMWLNWRLTLLALVLVPLSVFTTKYAGKVMKRATRRSLESMARIYKILQETLQGVKVVKAYTMEPAERLRFYRETKNLYKKSTKVARIDAMSDPVLEMLALSVVCLALLSGAYLVLKQTIFLDLGFMKLQLASEMMDIKDLLSIYAMLAGISDPVRKLANVHAKIQRATAAADRICALMDRTPRVLEKPNAIEPQRHSQSIDFDQLVFAYDGRPEPVLNGLSLSVRHGERIAIVGPNGCGKSTLMSLLPRFFELQSGSIRIDGLDTRDMRLRNLRSQIGLVTQETVLFEGTIAENIAYGSPHATREQIEAAAKQSYAHNFIIDQPNGYDTPIGERGMSLSGGQRQRLALARVMLRNPAILILDEATSAIDIEDELLIRKALEQFSRGRTTFIIAHSLGAIQFADRIVLINAGKVEAVGSDAELRKSSALYRRLHEIHFQKESA